MKTHKLFTIMLALVLLFAFSAFAGDEKVADKEDVKKELKAQTHCPVMGGKINSEIYTDIQGQRVYHCCPGCKKPLKEDPDKFFKKAAEEGVLFENIQTTCAVSGMKLEKKEKYTDFEGRRVYFCSDKCATAFDKEPQKYLSMMDMPSKEMKKEDHSKMNHEGH